MSFFEQHLIFCVVSKAITQVCTPMKSQSVKHGMVTANLNKMKSWRQILPKALRGPESASFEIPPFRPHFI
jgi:hypothetical protein